ncbi:hypothetical protein LR48_Vigan05g015400 [Vigna angularis]|nr:hypothetical protein LR48_Vigan05g015400 [Vigna angularis]
MNKKNGKYKGVVGVEDDAGSEGDATKNNGLNSEVRAETKEHTPTKAFTSGGKSVLC